MSVTGPIARTIEDLRVALAALSAPDARDPWWVPAPLEGPPMPLGAALCLRPGGMRIAKEVEAAVLDAGQRLAGAGWRVDEVEETPPLDVAAEVQERLWLGDGFKELAGAAARDGDPGANAVVTAVRARAEALSADVVARSLVRRASATRQWQVFLAKHPVLLLPVSAELPFRDGLDLEGEAAFQRVWQAQFVLRALPAMGLPGLTVSTALIGSVPVGVQIVAGRYREDLCLRAGKAIEAGGTPPTPIDPAA
jgi:amidase